MTLVSRIRRWLSPACAVPRLRVLYVTALALCGALLVMLHISIAGEQRLAHALTVETRAAVAMPRVIIVRAPLVTRATKVEHNIHRTAAATKEK